MASHPGLHETGSPGILSLDVSAKNSSMIVTGGKDKNVTVFNKDAEQVTAILKGHTKKVNRVIYHPTSEDTVISASHDSTIRLWNVPTKQTKFLHAHKVEYFAGAKAIDALVNDSPW